MTDSGMLNQNQKAGASELAQQLGKARNDDDMWTTSKRILSDLAELSPPVAKTFFEAVQEDSKSNANGYRLNLVTLSGDDKKIVASNVSGDPQDRYVFAVSHDLGKDNWCWNWSQDAHQRKVVITDRTSLQEEGLMTQKSAKLPCEVDSTKFVKTDPYKGTFKEQQ